MYSPSRILLLASTSSVLLQALAGVHAIDVEAELGEVHLQCATNLMSDYCQEAIQSVRCDSKYLDSASADPSNRWSYGLCIYQWLNVTEYWRAQTDPVLPFPRWINDQFHGRDNMDCQSLADKNGCSTNYLCDDLANPGQFLVMNSLVTINRMLWNYYDGLYNAKSDIQSIVPEIAETFSPVSDDLTTAQIIDIAMMAFSMSAAPFFNVYTKKMPAFSNGEHGDPNGLLKDTVNGLVANGLTLTKDSLAKDAANAAEKNLEYWMGQFVEHWASSTSEYAKKLFSGDQYSLSSLLRLISHGMMSATPTDSEVQDSLGAEGIKKLVKKALYADLIPRAWRLSNKPLGPFILKSKKKCDGSKIPYLGDKSRDTFGFCIDDEMYILTSAPDPSKHCGQVGDYSSCLDDFQDLPGADQLDGSKWSGLSVEDIVRGSFATWEKHSRANKGKTSLSEDSDIAREMEAYVDPGADRPADGFFEQVRNDGVRAAGIIAIPICEYKEAVDNWEVLYNKGGTPWETYPCNKV